MNALFRPCRKWNRASHFMSFPAVGRGTVGQSSVPRTLSSDCDGLEWACRRRLARRGDRPPSNRGIYWQAGFGYGALRRAVSEVAGNRYGAARKIGDRPTELIESVTRERNLLWIEGEELRSH